MVRLHLSAVAFASCFLAGLIIAADSAAQGLDPDPHDAGAGKDRYLQLCVSCHGANGDGIAAVDLGRGEFRRATSDDELVSIIQNGIPGTAMPANNLSNEAAASIVAYFRLLAESKTQTPSLSGDPSEGGRLIASLDCLDCHRVGAAGSRLGPDLNEVGRLRRSDELEAALLDPNALIEPEHQFVRLVQPNGDAVTGRLLNQDTFTIQIIDEQEALRSFDRSKLREVIFLDGSTMPSYRGRLNERQLADIVSFLSTLRGTRRP